MPTVTDNAPAGKATPARTRKRAAAKPAGEPVTAPDAPPAELAPAEPIEAAAPAADAEPAGQDAPGAVEPHTAFSEREHVMLDAMGVPTDRGGRALLFREWMRTGLDPFAKQIYLRQDSKTVQGMNEIGNSREYKIPVYSVGTNIDGFRLVANRQPTYRGQTPVMWCGDDGQWRDVWLGGNHAPYAARVGIVVEGYAAPAWGVAIYAEYKPATAGERSTWVKMAAHMNGIAAEALAIRRAYPDKLSGIYTDEEMAQRDDAEDLRPGGGDVGAAMAAPFDLAALAGEALAAVREERGTIAHVWQVAERHQAGNLLDVFLSDERATLAEVLQRIGAERAAAVAMAAPAHPADTSDSAGRCERCNHRLTLAQVSFGDTLCTQCAPAADPWDVPPA
jgi:hypothetical protein